MGRRLLVLALVLAVTGGADSVGGADANYELSQKRAEAVIQYLAQNYSVPANKFYLIGLGKDKPVASNKSDAGRAKNRRVDVRLMTNTVEEPTAALYQLHVLEVATLTITAHRSFRDPECAECARR